MPTIDDILRIGAGGTVEADGDFDHTAMEVFRRQAGLDGEAGVCVPYRDYLAAVGVDAAEVGSVDEIPYLPIELFKTHRVYCGEGEPEAVFTSSGTGGASRTGASKHYVARLADYERVFTRGFELFYGDPAGWNIRSLLPCYEEREGSSLIYMVDGLQQPGREGMSPTSAAPHLAPPGRRKNLLIGVSYALLDLAEQFAETGERLPAGTIVMETGGMKGRREEMPKSQMHKILQQAFGVDDIHSEYGMAELTSQAYSHGGGRFETPPWMRVSVRDLADPFDVRHTGKGGINIIDLANLNSCAFIQTQDIGTVGTDGSFTIDGRVARSDIRGCNLLVQ